MAFFGGKNILIDISLNSGSYQRLVPCLLDISHLLILISLVHWKCLSFNGISRQTVLHRGLCTYVSVVGWVASITKAIPIALYSTRADPTWIISLCLKKPPFAALFFPNLKNTNSPWAVLC